MKRNIAAIACAVGALLVPASAEAASAYSESRTPAGSTVVEFSLDSLSLGMDGARGGAIVARPLGVRVKLIRPRLNFVAELNAALRNM